MSKSKQQEKIEVRRQLIFRRVVLDNRPLSLKELRRILKDKNYSTRAAQRDAEMFRHVGCMVEFQPTPEKDDHEFVFLEGPHTDDDITRERIHVDEKKLVAGLTASLICGANIHPKENPQHKTLDPANACSILKNLQSESFKDAEIEHRIRTVLMMLDQRSKIGGPTGMINSTEDILHLLRQAGDGLGNRWRSLMTALFGFWSEPSRVIAIDSGTTNIILARLLKELDIPLSGSSLCSLTVCTNSSKVFHELAPSRVWIKTVIIGGQQLFRSPTIAGAIAEQFLRSVSMLQFGMCVIGSTRMDLDRFTACCDSQEEAALKNLLMDRSALRVICVDNSKLQVGPGREGYRFASIDPKHIDLIITNSPLRGSDDKSRADFSNFTASVSAIQDRGVPVLVATSPRTYGYKHKLLVLDREHLEGPSPFAERQLAGTVAAAGDRSPEVTGSSTTPQLADGRTGKI